MIVFCASLPLHTRLAPLPDWEYPALHVQLDAFAELKLLLGQGVQVLDWAKLNDPAKQPVRTSKTVEDSGSDDTVKTPNGRRPLPVAVGRGGLVKQVRYLCRKCRRRSPSQPRTLCSVRPQCQHTVSMWRTIEACRRERARQRTGASQRHA